MQRSSGSPGVGAADVRHFLFIATFEEQKAEKRGQHRGERKLKRGDESVNVTS